MKPTIGWHRWKNPYSLDEPDNDNWEKAEGEETLFSEESEESGPVQSSPIKAMMTPMGAIPLPEHSAPHKVFNMWVAHTNFDITNNVASIVENTPGVETLDIFTRYRMRIGIGQLFATANVIKHINNNLYQYIASNT